MNVKETVEEFLKRGGQIQVVQYKSFEEVPPPPPPGGMRAIIHRDRHKAFLKTEAA